MTEAGLFSAIFGGLVVITGALITVWRFRRKDRAEAQSVEDGTIASRFKDADALMRYVDESVEARVAPIRAELEASHSAIEAFREWVSQIWAWDRRGRQGNMPMVSGDMLRKLGLVHLTSVDLDEDTQPTKE